MTEFVAIARVWVAKEHDRARRTRFGLARSGRTVEDESQIARVVDPWRQPAETEDSECSQRAILDGFIREFTERPERRELIALRIRTGAPYAVLAAQFQITEATARTQLSRFYAYLGVSRRSPPR